MTMVRKIRLDQLVLDSVGDVKQGGGLGDALLVDVVGVGGGVEVHCFYLERLYLIVGGCRFPCGVLMDILKRSWVNAVYCPRLIL